MAFLKIFVLFVDLALFVWLVWSTIFEVHVARIGVGEVALLLSAYVVVILNLAYIFFSKTEKETWVGLFIERKKLEEQNKIKYLKNEQG